MVVTYCVDMDQVTCTGHVCPTLAESIAYYRARGVVVPDSIDSWPDLFQLPDVVRQHEVLPGAVEGVRKLTEGCKMFYLTARKPDVHDITREWLRREGFPSPDKVIFVDGVAEKLIALAEYDGPLFLVDDRWRQLLGILEEYGHRRRVLSGLLDRLTLVAFGASKSDIPLSSIVPVVQLLNWSWLNESSPQVIASSRKDGLS